MSVSLESLLSYLCFGLQIIASEFSKVVNSRILIFLYNKGNQRVPKP